MGMSSDQNENVSFKEQQEMKKLEEARKAAEAKKKHYTPLGTIKIKNKFYRLYVGEDKKWYKSEYLKSERLDEMNRTPLTDVFSKDIVPVTKEEFEKIFPEVKKKGKLV